MKLKSLIIIGICLFFYGNSYAQISVWDGVSSDKSWYDDSKDTYHLSTAAQFKGFADLTNNANQTFEGKTIYLDCDIDLANILWTPISNGLVTEATPFKGSFDGQKHSIMNIYVGSDTNPYNNVMRGDRSYYSVGLFGQTTNATIKNLNIKGKIITKEGQYCCYAGLLAGDASNTLFEQIVSDVNMEFGYNTANNIEIGGIVGSGYGSTFKKVKATGTINTLKGYSDASSQISKCGGISGSASGIEECEVDMNIKIYTKASGNTQYVGGCCGSSDVTDAIFTGSLEVYDSWGRNMGIMVGGISAYGSVTNAISAHSSFYANTKPDWCAGIVSPNTGGPVTNGRYVSSLNNPSNNGTSISLQKLKSGDQIDGFSSDIWSFTTGEYPKLKAFIRDTYKLTYIVDGEIIREFEYKPGQSIFVFVSSPWMEGYTFSGWSERPTIMPAYDVIVTGSFIPNKYKLTYMIDDETYKTYDVEYGSAITPEEAPKRDGYTFSGWSEIPAVMPAYDVTITGTFTPVNVVNHEYVDLGLPSGLLWATTNVGANSPEEYGSYFAWGETSPKSEYSWATYKYANGSETTLTKYCYSSEFGDEDNKYMLEEEDDAATVNWGKSWRLPTDTEAIELLTNCRWTKCKRNGVDGCLATGPNGNFIFFPFAGSKERTETLQAGSEFCYLLSTTLDETDGAPSYEYMLFSNGNQCMLAGEERCTGISARAVTNVNPNDIVSVSTCDSEEILGIYNLQGHKLDCLVKGINIVKYKNGAVKKVLVK